MNLTYSNFAMVIISVNFISCYMYFIVIVPIMLNLNLTEIGFDMFNMFTQDLFTEHFDTIASYR